MQRTITRWRAAAAAFLSVTALMMLTLPVEATSARTAQVSGSLKLSDNTVSPNQAVTVTGTLPPKRARSVTLQTWASGKWNTVATKQSSSLGAFRFSLQSPTRAGARQYRVFAPATTLSGKKHPALVTPTRTLTVVTMVAADAGWQHACVVGSDKRAWCWGDNTFGELGDGTPVSSTEKTSDGPVKVIGTGWTSVSTGGASTCGLKQNQTAWCWGDRASYWSDPTQSSTPQQVPGEWRQISQGEENNCGVHTDGTAWCWGDNTHGQLGTEEPGASQTPLQVPGTWSQVVAGVGSTSVTTCGIKQDLSAWCWGAGGSGQLGNNDIASSATPVAVAGGHEWASLTVGEVHTCGIDTDGVGWCWGQNPDGRLGDGTFAERHEPVRVTVSGTWKELDAGLQHTCGVTTDGAGWCWGWNDQGQLGDGSNTTTYWPEPMPSLLPGTWTDVAAGYYSSAGTKVSGTAWAWGSGGHGELGNGSSDPSLDPLRVPVAP